LPRGDRRCDLEASFPQVVWLVGDASLATWRGEIDFWCSATAKSHDQRLVNGNAQESCPTACWRLSRSSSRRPTGASPSASRRRSRPMTPTAPHDHDVAPERSSDRASAKHDRLARFYRVIRYLQATRGRHSRCDRRFRGHVQADRLSRPPGPGGRDRDPAVGEAGKWGSSRGVPAAAAPDAGRGRGLLPRGAADGPVRRPLRARYGAAFQKLAEILPSVVARHLERTIDVLASRPPDEQLTRNLRTLAEPGPSGGRGAHLRRATYSPGRPPRRSRVHPYLLEASVDDPGPVPDGFDESRDAIRTFKLQRILELSLTPDTFEPPEPRVVQERLGRPGASSPTRKK